MDFKQAYLSALRTNTSLTKTIMLQDYLPKTLPVKENQYDNLPCVLAYGNIPTCYPYYYEIAGLDSYCLLYSESGAGSLTIDNHPYPLAADTIAIIDCREKHRIEIKQSQWNYKVFFFKGNPIPFLFHIITPDHGYVHAVSSESALPDMIKRFYVHLSKNEEDLLLHMKFLFDILLEIVLEINRQKETVFHIPEFLVKIKYNFDTNYCNNYSLDLLEQEHHISKYRICREFAGFYGVSPMQYLNYKRIEVVKEALVTSDKRINEIGRMVGFENTNHLIRLFKKYTGVTPLNYRKQSPVFTYIH